MNDFSQRESARGEWIRFGILIVVMLGTILVVALIRPFIANRVVPAFLSTPDTHQLSLPVIDASGGEEATMEDASEGVMEGEQQPVDTEVGGGAPGSETAVEQSAEETTVEPAVDNAAATESNLTHVIQSGESLFVLAQRYNVSVQQIVEANGIGNPDRIAVGDELIIPQP